MKKISFRLSSIATAIETYNFLKDFRDIASFYYITIDRNVVEINGIPDYEIERVIQILLNFFSLGVVSDCIDTKQYSFSKDSLLPSTLEPLATPDYAKLNALATTFIENLHTSNVLHDKLMDYLSNCINDLYPYIHVTERLGYYIGDIVKINTPSDFYFEFNSMKSNVYGLICNIPNSAVACIVPIISKTNLAYAEHVIPVLPSDISDELDNLSCPTAMLDYARYVSTSKFEPTHAKASTIFFKTVTNALALIFNFANISFQNTESTTKAITHKKLNSRDETLTKIFSSTLSSIPENLPISEKIIMFLSLIGFPRDQIIIDTFFIAYHADKITYDAIISELQEKYNYTYNTTMQSIKLAFSNWFSAHPEIAVAYPKLSLISLIKFFVNCIK